MRSFFLALPVVMAVATVWATAWAAEPKTAPSPSPIVGPEDAVPAEPPAPTAPTPAEASTAAEKKARLLRAEVAQLMFVTLSGLYGPNNDDRALLARFTPGGVIIPVIARPAHAADYVKQIRSLVSSVKAPPPFIGADLYNLSQNEGRTLGSFVQLPSLLSVAAASDSASTTLLGKLVSEHLNTMGFNLNVGPSLALAPAVSDAVGTTRTLGGSPVLAAETAKDLVSTLTQNGLLAMPLGFPGGGLNRQGESPAVLLTPRARLAEEDLRPFRSAIAGGADLINVGNTLVPTLDAASPPASVSRVAIQELLRGELGFTGVIVAGPLDSADTRRTIDPAEAAVRALEAGADMIYWSQGGAHVGKAIEVVALAVERGEIPKSRIDEALYRVGDLKERKGLHVQEMPDPRKAAALEKRGRYPKEAYAIERRAITLVKNEGGVLPLKKDIGQPIGVTGVAGTSELKTAVEKLHIKPVVEQPILTARHLGEIEDFEIQRLVSGWPASGTVICVLADMRKSSGQVRLVHELKAKGVRVVVVLLGYPSNLPKLAEADAIVVAYCEPYRCGEAMKAVADVLAGKGALDVLSGIGGLKVRAGVSETFDVQKIALSPAGRLPVSFGKPFDAGMSVSYDPAVFVKRVEWDFGDGQRAKDFRVEHVYEAPGQYTLKVTVVDQQGEMDMGEFAIEAE